MQIQLRQDARTNIPTAISPNRNNTLDGRAARTIQIIRQADRLHVQSRLQDLQQHKNEGVV
jgi:hypothetical protein